MSSSRTSVHRPEKRQRASDAGRSRLGDLTRPIGIDRRITRRRRSNLFLGVIALVIAGAIAAALFVLPVQTYFGQNEALARRQAQLEQLNTVNGDLQREVDRLGTDDGVREAAREEIGYVGAGEVRQSLLEFPELPTDLPDGWPYDLVTAIVAIRTAASAP